MAQQPVEVNDKDYSMTAPKLKPFRFKASTSLERIQDTLRANSHLEQTPTDLKKTAFTLRPRDQSKEVGPGDFKFRARSTVQRVYDSVIQNQNGLYLDGTDLVDEAQTKSPKTMRHKLTQAQRLLSDGRDKLTPKKLMSQYH